jgi:hypothetical protein
MLIMAETDDPVTVTSSPESSDTEAEVELVSSQNDDSDSDPGDTLFVLSDSDVSSSDDFESDSDTAVTEQRALPMKPRSLKKRALVLKIVTVLCKRYKIAPPTRLSKPVLESVLAAVTTDPQAA